MLLEAQERLAHFPLIIESQMEDVLQRFAQG